MSHSLILKKLASVRMQRKLVDLHQPPQIRLKGNRGPGNGTEKDSSSSSNFLSLQRQFDKEVQRWRSYGYSDSDIEWWMSFRLGHLFRVNSTTATTTSPVSHCRFCSKGPETPDHFFFHCQVARYEIDRLLLKAGDMCTSYKEWMEWEALNRTDKVLFTLGKVSALSTSDTMKAQAYEKSLVWWRSSWDILNSGNDTSSPWGTLAGPPGFK